MPTMSPIATGRATPVALGDGGGSASVAGSLTWTEVR